MDAGHHADDRIDRSAVVLTYTISIQRIFRGKVQRDQLVY
jgi:hypothetical protein